MREATTAMSRAFGLSQRQAYRYLHAARGLDQPALVPAASIPVTIKIPGDVVEAMRAHAKTQWLDHGRDRGACRVDVFVVGKETWLP